MKAPRTSAGPAGLASCSATTLTVAGLRFSAAVAASAAARARPAGDSALLAANAAATTVNWWWLASRTRRAAAAAGTPASAARRVVSTITVPTARAASARSAGAPAAVWSPSGDTARPSWACTCAVASARVLPLSCTTPATTVVSGLTKTDWAPLLPLGGAVSSSAAPMAAPVSLSTALAGTRASTACLPAIVASTSNRYRPSVSVNAVGSPASQAPLSFWSWQTVAPCSGPSATTPV